MSKKQKILLFRIIVGAVLTTAGYILKAVGFSAIYYLILFIAASLTVGYSVIFEAFNNVFHGHMLDENFLMMIGAVGAFILGDYSEGTLILLIYQIGELFQSIAVGKSRKSISSLMDIKADYANIKQDGQIVKADPYDVETGTEIYILPGEKVPIDCVVVSGSSDINTAALTGESLPRTVNAGDELLSGCVNLSGDLVCKTTKTFENSTVSNILNMVENATAKKTKTESFVTRFAKYYTPAVVGAAVLLFLIPSIITGSYTVWLYRAIMFLVVSCPCALVVSVPLAFFGAIGGASKNGILIKGSKYMESLCDADTVIFDKTGTITKGNFKITQIITNNCSEEELLKFAALCEYHSSHPIALSIKERIDVSDDVGNVTDYKIISGKGAQCNYKNKVLLAGNFALMRLENIDFTPTDLIGTAVYVAYDGKFLGTLIINDSIKETSADSIRALRAMGLKTVMLTGDKYAIAKSIADKTGIDEIKAELLPEDKVKNLEGYMHKNGKKVIFVGDGINDAPVLARADIGISMGQIGSDAAIEASDIVIMNDDLSLIAKAIKISRKAIKISKENIVFSLAVKFTMLILSAFGISNIYMAIFADVGVLILAIINSMRTLATKE